MRKRMITMWLGSLLLALSLSACGGSQQSAPAASSASSEEASQEDAATGDTAEEEAENESAGETSGDETKDSITVYVGTTIFGSSLDPVKGAMSYGYPFTNNALLKVDTNSEYIGDLATDWEISDDALTYTVNLKDGIKFSDGSDFTAEDVVFTYETVKENQGNNSAVDLTRMESVEAPDDKTVVFTLSEPYSPFFDNLAMLQIVPSDAYDSTLFDTKPIGTGAWKVVEYDTEQQIMLEANEDCFMGAPAIKGVTLVYMDQDAAFAAAMSGQLDIVMVGAGFASQEVPGMEIRRFETMDVRKINLPVREASTVTDEEGNEITIGNDVTADKAVREALTIGIDRASIIENALNGVGVPAMGFTDNLIWANTKETNDNRVDEAVKILEDAGWTDTDGDGIREKGDLRCGFDIYAPGTDNDRYLLAAALAEDAKKLGIEINVKTATWDEVNIDPELRKTNGIVYGYGQYSPTVLYNLFHSDRILTGGSNAAGLDNAAVDEKIDKALNAVGEERAVAAWKEVQTLANAEYPYLYLVNIEHCYFVKQNLDISMETQIAHPHGHGSPIICNMQDWSFSE